MIFKPRIFISSTINENLSIRSEIEDFFKSIGAEIMLYEKNLTPSVRKLTYRYDINDADFVIFIIKNNYGNTTSSGISGTHEELKIVLETKIPSHVYIKENKDETDSKPIIDEIKENDISYFIYNDDNDLLKRIKETTFTIAKEIMLKRIDSNTLDKLTVRKIAVNYDYNEAVRIIKLIELMKKIGETGASDWVYSNLVDSFMEPLQYIKTYHGNLFIDKKLEDLLDEMLLIYDEFGCHYKDFTSVDAHKFYDVPIFGEIMVTKCNMHQYSIRTPEYYVDIIKNFLQKFEELKKYVQEMRLSTDTAI